MTITKKERHAFVDGMTDAEFLMIAWEWTYHLRAVMADPAAIALVEEAAKGSLQGWRDDVTMTWIPGPDPA